MSYCAKGGHGYGNFRKGSAFGIGRQFNNNKLGGSYQPFYQGVNSMRPLTDFGWFASAPDEVRHQALLQSIQAEGFGATRVKLLNYANMALNEEMYQAVQSDILWLDTEAVLP